MDNKNKKNNKTKKENKISIATILITIFLIYIAYITSNQSKIISSKQEELVDLHMLIQEEQKLNEQLNDRLELVNTKEEIKRVARQKLGLVKMGERIFIDSNIK